MCSFTCKITDLEKILEYCKKNADTEHDLIELNYFKEFDNLSFGIFLKDGVIDFNQSINTFDDFLLNEDVI